jgi:hypothetical protein
VQLSLARAAYRRWQAAAGPWQGWTICPALLSPELEEITPRPIARDALTRVQAISDRLAAGLRRPERADIDIPAGWTMLQIELDPSLGVLVAARLHQLGLAHPLLILPRWPYATAVLPTDTLLGALLRGAEQVGAPPDDHHLCLVLDADRERQVVDRPADDPRADNRYRLSLNDLPDLSALRRRGITRLVKVTSNSGLDHA